MRNPQFGRIPYTGRGRSAAANLAKDGSGALVQLAVGRRKVAAVTADATTNLITVTNWSRVSIKDQVEIYNGDIVSLISGSAPGGLSNNTDYYIGDLIYVESTDTATFRLYDTSFVAIDITTAGTNPVMQFPGGTRIDSCEFRSAQASRAANGTMTICLFQSDRYGANFRFVGESLFTAITGSATVAGQQVVYTPVGGIILDGGEVLSFTSSVYGGAQDQIDGIAKGAHF